MMIQTDVTSDSSLLRATCENRLSPSLCQSGLCRTEVRAQCSRWPAFAVIVKSCDMQSESAIAGDRRIKACWVALHAFWPRGIHSGVPGILRVGGAESRFDSGQSHHDIERSVPDASLCRSASGCRPVSLAETGKANSLTLLSSRAREISSRALLGARLPLGPGTAALGGSACRSRAVKPDHAPTPKGREHDLIARAVPGPTRGYL